MVSGNTNNDQASDTLGTQKEAGLAAQTEAGLGGNLERDLIINVQNTRRQKRNVDTTP